MKERPILFSAPMVRAILAGEKTQTRRIIKPQPISNGFGPPDPVHDIPCHCDYYPPSAMLWPDGNGGMLNVDAGHPWVGVGQLWVKETFTAKGAFGADGRIVYRASIPYGNLDCHFKPWTPSIFMPRRASRITLEITDVRAERLHAITEADAIAEGCRVVQTREQQSDGSLKPITITARFLYQQLWNAINGPGSWDANQYVWVITFKKLLP